MLPLRREARRLQLQAKFYRENITLPTATRRWDFLCFCCGFTQFNFYYGHSHGRIWNPPLRSANPVAFCLPPTSAGWGHPALHPTGKGECRAASPLAAVPVCAVLHHPGNRTTYPGHAAGHRPADKCLPCQREVDAAGGRRDSDGLCPVRCHTRRRAGIPPPRRLGTSL